jgi:hypothetical protein
MIDFDPFYNQLACFGKHAGRQQLFQRKQRDTLFFPRHAGIFGRVAQSGIKHGLARLVRTNRSLCTFAPLHLIAAPGRQ